MRENCPCVLTLLLAGVTARSNAAQAAWEEGEDAALWCHVCMS